MEDDWVRAYIRKRNAVVYPQAAERKKLLDRIRSKRRHAAEREARERRRAQRKKRSQGPGAKAAKAAYMKKYFSRPEIRARERDRRIKRAMEKRRKRG